MNGTIQVAVWRKGATENPSRASQLDKAGIVTIPIYHPPFTDRILVPGEDVDSYINAVPSTCPPEAVLVTPNPHQFGTGLWRYFCDIVNPRNIEVLRLLAQCPTCFLRAEAQSHVTLHLVLAPHRNDLRPLCDVPISHRNYVPYGEVPSDVTHQECWACNTVRFFTNHGFKRKRTSEEGTDSHPLGHPRDEEIYSYVAGEKEDKAFTWHLWSCPECQTIAETIHWTRQLRARTMENRIKNP